MKDKAGIYMVSIVAIVAVVSIITMLISSNGNTLLQGIGSSGNANSVGQAYGIVAGSGSSSLSVSGYGVAVSTDKNAYTYDAFSPIMA